MTGGDETYVLQEFEIQIVDETNADIFVDGVYSDSVSYSGETIYAAN